MRAIWDGFPVSPGHLLIVPKRHAATWFDATQEERIDLVSALDRAKELVASRHNPDGYNIGVNAGAAAGQTVLHLHVHLIPATKVTYPTPAAASATSSPARAATRAWTHEPRTRTTTRPASSPAARATR